MQDWFENGAADGFNEVALSARGLVQRTYGGAIFNPESRLDSPFDARSSLHAEAKRRVGGASARSIAPGETIILDSGSTTIEIARQLPENRDITVITCALNVALEAAARHGVTVIVCGGRLNARTLSTADQQTQRQLSGIFADRLLLATYGVHFEKGLAERSFEIAETKRSLIAAAREVTLVCVSSKFDSAGPVLISPLSVAKQIITDGGISADQLAWLRTNDIEVEVV
ncbi:MAG: DeoR/GlpR family DNA-binding transcription regulator [Pseudomonadota bacterium]|nr:DeoR/GlpR family DNA-binding transcription regulator [Pseudomonadota bacterium]